jgi:membrane-associated phospholipid phosphatase
MSRGVPASQVVAFCFIAFGIFRFFGGAGIGGLWIAFIGWFLLQASRESFVRVGLAHALKGVRVADVMTRDCPTIDGWLNLQNFVEQELLRTRSPVAELWTVRLPLSWSTHSAIFHNAKARETGILGGEAVLDSLIIVGVTKEIFQRPRPLENKGSGDFFSGGVSFPSGHAADSWALASVMAHEYNKNIAVPIVAYGLASLISFSRLSGQQHFASDVVAGSAIGWYIGRYVFKTHVDHSIHRRPPSKLGGLAPRMFPQFDPASHPRRDPQLGISGPLMHFGQHCWSIKRTTPAEIAHV